MSKIIYKKMSLFDAPKDSYIAHGCNGQGVWGSGIAKDFKEKFPASYKQYFWHCSLLGKEAPGTAAICDEENDYNVVCLITSGNFGAKVDSPEKILEHTKFALEDLIQSGIPSVFYSNKFNSGLFNVKWEKTEKLLQDFINKYNIDWIVCDPNLKEEDAK